MKPVKRYRTTNEIMSLFSKAAVALLWMLNNGVFCQPNCWANSVVDMSKQTHYILSGHEIPPSSHTIQQYDLLWNALKDSGYVNAMYITNGLQIYATDCAAPVMISIFLLISEFHITWLNEAWCDVLKRLCYLILHYSNVMFYTKRNQSTPCKVF